MGALASMDQQQDVAEKLEALKAVCMSIVIEAVSVRASAVLTGDMTKKLASHYSSPYGEFFSLSLASMARSNS